MTEGGNFSLGVSLTEVLAEGEPEEEMIQPPANATFTVHRAETDVLPPVDVSFQLPDVVEEASIQDVTPHPEGHQGEFTVTYEVIKGGSKEGQAS